MVKFRTAAIIAGVFVILGAVFSGSGTSQTLGRLGSVNEIAGAFMVALSAGFTVMVMTRLQLPVSTSQAIVGAIIGWNFFSGTLTDMNALGNIALTWVMSPVIAAVFSLLLYRLFILLPRFFNIHLFRLDAYTRIGLIVVGAFGAYSLGANNIANVMGVFVPVAHFQTLHFGSILELTGQQQLFLMGGIAIAVGIVTYSKRVMITVGQRLMRLTPQAALIVVLAEALVLFIFASRGLRDWVVSLGLPAIPLVPISSSQAVIGAVIGIGFAHGGRNIRGRVLMKIASGWIITPIIASVITFVALFFLQNVFNQKVYQPVTYEISVPVAKRLETEGVKLDWISPGIIHKNPRAFKSALERQGHFTRSELEHVFDIAEIYPMKITDVNHFDNLVSDWFSREQIDAVKNLHKRSFRHKWQMETLLLQAVPAWSADRLNYVFKYFHVKSGVPSSPINYPANRDSR